MITTTAQDRTWDYTATSTDLVSGWETTFNYWNGKEFANDGDSMTMVPVQQGSTLMDIDNVKVYMYKILTNANQLTGQTGTWKALN